MKVICQGLDLSEAVLKVSKALPTRSVSPALEGIKLSAKDESLIISATDGDLTIQNIISADVLREGEVLVPGRFFTEYVRKLTNEQIELSLNDAKQIVIKYTDSEGVIQCLDQNEYPPFIRIDDAPKVLVTEEYLRECIEKVIFSVSTDDSRPALKGSLFEIEEYTLTAVALDGYRLALCKKPLETSAEKLKAVVPARSLTELSKLLENDDNVATVYINGKYMFVDLGKTNLCTKLLNSEFINYRQIIPTEFSTVIKINKSQFENALDRASILSRGDKNNLVKFDIKEGLLTLTSNSEIGNIKENITISLQGKDLTVAFNARYFSDCLKAMNNEFIKISLTNSVSPSIVQPCESDEITYLILPVRMVG
ncbi:MAG TPA: DNA polymerase III subunit beta [Eubacteriales bacterium]|nr:DNA polymerase III subunit beta [Eubacteriales bacterium]